MKKIKKFWEKLKNKVSKKKHFFPRKFSIEKNDFFGKNVSQINGRVTPL